jgi:dynactin complex subunit
MGTNSSQLKKLKGIGSVLAGRLVKAGMNTHQDIAEASPEALRSIQGMKDKDIAVLQEQARTLIAQDALNHEIQLKSLLENAERLKADINTLVGHLRDETLHDPSSQSAKSVRKEISRIMAALDMVETTLFSQMQRLGKGLAKADAKLAKVKNGTEEEISEGLKKARKKLDQALD